MEECTDHQAEAIEANQMAGLLSGVLLFFFVMDALHGPPWRV